MSKLSNDLIKIYNKSGDDLWILKEKFYSARRKIQGGDFTPEKEITALNFSYEISDIKKVKANCLNKVSKIVSPDNLDIIVAEDTELAKQIDWFKFCYEKAKKEFILLKDIADDIKKNKIGETHSK